MLLVVCTSTRGASALVRTGLYCLLLLPPVVNSHRVGPISRRPHPLRPQPACEHAGVLGRLRPEEPVQEPHPQGHEPGDQRRYEGQRGMPTHRRSVARLFSSTRHLHRSAVDRSSQVHGGVHRINSLGFRGRSGVFISVERGVF